MYKELSKVQCIKPMEVFISIQKGSNIDLADIFQLIQSGACDFLKFGKTISG